MMATLRPVTRYRKHVYYRGPYWGAVRAANGRAVSRNIEGSYVCAYGTIDAAMLILRLTCNKCIVQSVATVRYGRPDD